VGRLGLAAAEAAVGHGNPWTSTSPGRIACGRMTRKTEL